MLFTSLPLLLSPLLAPRLLPFPCISLHPAWCLFPASRIHSSHSDPLHLLTSPLTRRMREENEHFFHDLEEEARRKKEGDCYYQRDTSIAQVQKATALASLRRSPTHPRLPLPSLLSYLPLPPPPSPAPSSSPHHLFPPRLSLPLPPGKIEAEDEAKHQANARTKKELADAAKKQAEVGRPLPALLQLHSSSRRLPAITAAFAATFSPCLFGYTSAAFPPASIHGPLHLLYPLPAGDRHGEVQ